jgi:4-hydroxy 2-oxovalerate aldolase
MGKRAIKFLDCTLRDGGYYNNWDFDYDLVELYLTSMEHVSIDVIEIGFRSPPKSSFMGPYLYSLDEHLESLKLPKNILIGVMINAKEYLESPENPLEMINKMFQSRDNTPVGLVRIAINFDHVLEAEVLAGQLKKLGYQVGLNMMQSHGKEDIQYQQTAKLIAKWGTVDVLYFADSLGNMDPVQITSICKSILSAWKGELGIHTHNNKNLALINSLTALDAGVTWCDSTVAGMGRGAGNVASEALLMEAKHIGLHSGNGQVLSSCLKKFDLLKEQFKWGPNTYYHYAANHNIHPTYVQFLLSDPRYDPNQIESILESLSEKHSASFSRNALRESIFGIDNKAGQGSWDATAWLNGRTVLLVGSGQSVDKYRQAILNFIQKHKPFVIFLNINPHMPNDIGDATVIANESRFLFDAKRFCELKHPLIMPFSNLLEDELGEDIKELEILDYGLILEDDTFDIRAKCCHLQWPLAIAYALSIVTQAFAKEVLMVGFDGYESQDPRQEEMNEILTRYDRLHNRLPLKSLTPTSYPIQQGSVFEPIIQIKDFVVVIPARYQSSRFPGKPLADLCGKSLIRRVWDKCVQAVGHDQVIVATDDESIRKHCLEQGMHVMMTSNDNQTGSDRVCEVAKKLEREIYINVQGDEPLIEPEDILTVLEKSRNCHSDIINAMCPIYDEKDFRSPDVPKVVTAPDGRLLYISRSPIPTGKKNEFKSAMRQVCIYAFPRKAILAFGKNTKKTKIEAIEDIEILRFLEMGFSIQMVEVKGSPVAVDTPEDLKRAQALLTI